MSNPTRRGYRKRIIEIWQECASFLTKQRIADQVKIIIKKDWFSDREMHLEIHQKINNEQNSNAVPDTLSIIKQKHPKQNEQPNLENGNTAQQNNAQQKSFEENLKRIMNSEKTTLPSLGNIELRTVMSETNKINQVQPDTSTNNITELNELIYAGAKLVCEKIGILSKSTMKKSKPGWEIRLETQIKEL